VEGRVRKAGARTWAAARQEPVLVRKRSPHVNGLHEGGKKILPQKKVQKANDEKGTGGKLRKKGADILQETARSKRTQTHET